MKLDLLVLSTVPPFSEIPFTKTSKVHVDAHILRGGTKAAVSKQGEVTFDRVCFTIGTAELPGGKVHLLVASQDSRVCPFLLENISVRSKHTSIRQVISAREKAATLFSC